MRYEEEQGGTEMNEEGRGGTRRGNSRSEDSVALSI